MASWEGRGGGKVLSISSPLPQLLKGQMAKALANFSCSTDVRCSPFIFNSIVTTAAVPSLALHPARLAMTNPNPNASNSSSASAPGMASTSETYVVSDKPKSAFNPACVSVEHTSSVNGVQGQPCDRGPTRKPFDISSMSKSKVPSVRLLPGGEMRNRHRGPNPYNRRPSQDGEPGRELPMHYSLPVKTPVAGKYVPPPPSYVGMQKWEWWAPSVKYWATCQGCYEDEGCFAPDGFCDACDWRCCLSCWCPWWFGGPSHQCLGWDGHGHRQRRPS